MDYPKVKVCLDTSEDNLIDELYTPCLKWAERFDRGVGYFTTGWLTYNVAGLSDFASRGGKMRLITSPMQDIQVLNHSQTFPLSRHSCLGYPRLALCLGKCGLSDSAFVSLKQVLLLVAQVC